MISKKELLENIRKLKEAPIDYGDLPDRMKSGIEDKLARRDTDFKDNPAIPNEVPDGVPSNFEELIASKRFKDIVTKLKRYTGMEGNVTDNLFGLVQLVQRTLREIGSFESQNKEYLENLAVELVKKEMSVPEGTFQFDAKLVGMEDMDLGGMKMQGEDPSEEEIEQQFGVSPEEAEEDIENFMTSFEKFDAEVAKRRFINAMIQGASNKGHYMFELVADELSERDPNIVTKYGVVMSMADIGYWLFDDEMIMGQLQGGNSPMAGKQELDAETDPPTIKARGLVFPVLVHELIKGVMESITNKGLPEDPRSEKMVTDKTDTLAGEIWDLRLGPVIWEKFRESYPDKLAEDEYKHLQNYLISRFTQLDVNEFFKVAKEILRGSELGKEIVSKMVNQIIDDIKTEDYEEDEYDREYGDDEDDGLSGLLGSLGINLSPDDDDTPTV
jgi:hypothetical protein